MPYIEEQIFENEDYTETPLETAEYEYCTFLNCNFSFSTLAGIRFMNCEFKGCDLSNVKLEGTAFQEVKFTDSKLIGLHFETCEAIGFGIDFTNCNLNHASFYQKKLQNTHFKDCQLHEVEFTESDLTKAIFENSDLSRAVFEQTNLQKANFKTAFNYTIDPELNRIKQAQFSLPEIVGLLRKYPIKIVE